MTGDDETALECFESLIHLANEQLNHVWAEKSKLPPLTVEEREELTHKVCLFILLSTSLLYLFSVLLIFFVLLCMYSIFCLKLYLKW